MIDHSLTRHKQLGNFTIILNSILISQHTLLNKQAMITPILIIINHLQNINNLFPLEDLIWHILMLIPLTLQDHMIPDIIIDIIQLNTLDNHRDFIIFIQLQYIILIHLQYIFIPPESQDKLLIINILPNIPLYILTYLLISIFYLGPCIHTQVMLIISILNVIRHINPPLIKLLFFLKVRNSSTLIQTRIRIKRNPINTFPPQLHLQFLYCQIITQH